MVYKDHVPCHVHPFIVHNPCLCIHTFLKTVSTVSYWQIIACVSTLSSKLCIHRFILANHCLCIHTFLYNNVYPPFHGSKLFIVCPLFPISLCVHHFIVLNWSLCIHNSPLNVFPLFHSSKSKNKRDS